MCCRPWGRKESDTTEELNWTDWVNNLPKFQRIANFFIGIFMDWMYMISPVPLSSYMGALTPSITIFVVRKYFWLNEIVRVGPWSKKISVLMRRDIKKLTGSGSMCTQGRQATWRPSKKVAAYKWGRKAQQKLNPVGPRSWTFYPPELGENTCLLFEAPCLWCFAE